MANTVISPNMNMPVPVVSVDPGPDWATNVNACLSIVDSHNHTPGQGVAITPAAININADLPFNVNNLVSVRSVRYTPQGTAITQPGDLGCTYVLGADFYYIDTAGNQVRLTQGGAPAGATGTITGLPSGTASASFSGTTFTFQSATNTPATMSVGPVVIAQPVPSGFGVTVSPNVAQASNYNLALPIALPVTQSAAVSDSSGNLSFLQLDAGTYTPAVLTGGAGSGWAAAGTFFFHRIGNVVTVSGTLTGSTDVSPPFQLFTLVGLPINPSAPFAASGDLTGSVSGILNPSATPVLGGISADVGTGFAIVVLQYQTSFTPTYQVMFTYSCA